MLGTFLWKAPFHLVKLMFNQYIRKKKLHRLTDVMSDTEYNLQNLNQVKHTLSLDICYVLTVRKIRSFPIDCKHTSFLSITKHCHWHGPTQNVYVELSHQKALEVLPQGVLESSIYRTLLYSNQGLSRWKDDWPWELAADKYLCKPSYVLSRELKQLNLCGHHNFAKSVNLLFSNW